ncbi:maleylpyruvate isomerase N-terminal domain-containing protein [Actinotalea solisilvae]|uniref:maleylpyruvate isomerase N-terminal domain-containing protein n=1 Tax=Actinotalea solisilvae TaxID=2072922 RepID=UPI0018F19780|nr:maleylpyruvate isomerase N-terminal domain-containing protein [Actinotalea solisilvae]
MGPTWTEARGVVAEAAAWFVATAALVGDRWSHPGLGEWDVRALVGHTSRSLLTIEAYLATPAASVDVPTTVEYYRATRAIAAGPDVAQRGRDAGAALGADPAAAVATIAARVLPLLDRTDGTELVTTVAGGMRLADYVPTRTFELVVHTLDLAAALGEPAEPPARPAAQALRLVADLAAGAPDLAGPLLLAATGRRGLPDGFTVL